MKMTILNNDTFKAMHQGNTKTRDERHVWRIETPSRERKKRQRTNSETTKAKIRLGDEKRILYKRKQQVPSAD
jgi:hypothetical protein